MMYHNPEWDACKKHAPDAQSMKIAYDMAGSSPGFEFVFIRLKCVKCGCPGETILEMPVGEITWDPEED